MYYRNYNCIDKRSKILVKDNKIMLRSFEKILIILVLLGNLFITSTYGKSHRITSKKGTCFQNINFKRATCVVGLGCFFRNEIEVRLTKVQFLTGFHNSTTIQPSFLLQISLPNLRQIRL